MKRFKVWVRWLIPNQKAYQLKYLELHAYDVKLIDNHTLELLSPGGSIPAGRLALQRVIDHIEEVEPLEHLPDPNDQRP